MKKLFVFFTFYFSLFTFLCSAQYKVLWNFRWDTGAVVNANGASPSGSLTLVHNKLYGMTGLGGTHGIGNIFLIDTNGTGYKDMFDCIKTAHAPYGAEPEGDLIFTGKNLYGVMIENGINLGGTLISIDTNGSGIRDLADFPGADDVFVIEANLAYSHGRFYGMSELGGINQDGNIFSIDTNGGGFSDLYQFNNAALDQINSLIISGNKLFGMTYGGGVNGLGNIFTVDTNGNNFKELHDFNGTDGEYPPGSYLTISGNKLFGMTYQGGNHNDGCIFSLDTSGSNYKVLLNFNGTNGDSSYCSLIIFGNKLYGMTTFGGAYNWGCIFSIDTDGTGYTDLHDFKGYPTDGAQPFGSLTISEGVLYGMTEGGGTYNVGTIFRYNDTTIKKDVGVSELRAKSEEVRVFPNPSNGTFTLALSNVTARLNESFGQEKCSVEVYNVLGERVLTSTLPPPFRGGPSEPVIRAGASVSYGSNISYNINLSSQPNGVYFYRVVGENGGLVGDGKVVIER